MIFSVQRFLEDYFVRRGFDDPDQYAVKVANAFDASTLVRSEGARSLAQVLARIRTAFFRTNSSLVRAEFEAQLAELLASKFKKKTAALQDLFPGGLDDELSQVRKLPRRSIRNILDIFRQTVEAKAVDPFWSSRRAGRLLRRPEKIAQALLTVFFQGVIGRRGLVLREVGSGVGFIDIIVLFSNVPHLVELKILTSNLKGPKQLAEYMRNERRREGWLVVFDARQAPKSAPVPSLSLPAGRVRVVSIDINPKSPSTV